MKSRYLICYKLEATNGPPMNCCHSYIELEELAEETLQASIGRLLWAHQKETPARGFMRLGITFLIKLDR